MQIGPIRSPRRCCLGAVSGATRGPNRCRLLSAYRTDFPLGDKLIHRLGPFVDCPFTLAMQLGKARFDQPVLLLVLRVFQPQLDLRWYGSARALFSFSAVLTGRHAILLPITRPGPCSRPRPACCPIAEARNRTSASCGGVL